MLLAGRGGFHDGPPQFDAYYAEPRTAEQIPDGHGQDEDHYYWYAIEPTRSFESEFGKPMAQATHDEEVVYWARCFADKWRGVQDSLRPHAPDTGLWFYAPFPGIAYVDPVDSYDLFLGTLAQELGDALTALPFYYGMEYNQAEYIVRRWKDAGAARVVFLPMRDFVAKPSQFIRAITAARRGGADGTCGFNFAVGDGEPQDQWQWKAVMLAAWANFPTPDLDAYSLMEEPAELVEHLAQSGLQVRVESKAGDFDASGMLAQLREALPGARSAHGDSQAAHLTILVTNRPPALGNPDALGPAWRAGKGFLRMDGRTLHLSGANAEALGHACNLLLRFAEVARHESEIPAPPGPALTAKCWVASRLRHHRRVRVGALRHAAALALLADHIGEMRHNSRMIPGKLPLFVRVFRDSEQFLAAFAVDLLEEAFPVAVTHAEFPVAPEVPEQPPLLRSLLRAGDQRPDVLPVE